MVGHYGIEKYIGKPLRMEPLLIAKIGVNIIDNEQALNSFLTDLAAIPGAKLLVHGGGKLATELSNQMGIPTQMVNGRRITDEATIRVVTMVYAGLINKKITAQLQAKQCNAIGLCGIDGQLIPAIKRPVKEVDFGWVGDILYPQVNHTLFSHLLRDGLLPVIAPISGDAEGNLLNINADTMAGAVAQALCPYYNVTLVYCFEKNGLLANVDDDNSVIPNINTLSAEALKQNGTINKGMIPKIDNALQATNAGVQRVVIGHARHIANIAAQQNGYGTTLEQ
jgi:acetylglutamate kinase